MLLSSLSLLFLPIITAAKSTCLPSGDEHAINQALSSGGKGALVQLCAGSVHRLQSPIQFTAPRQTLTTEGNPKERGRALIVVEGAQQATAISADCNECSFATISSIEVDGNRPQLLRIKKGDALIEIGNAEGQTVRDCRLYEPRGWSALHFREGNLKQCKNGLVTANEIGPCGEEWDDEYDTTDELNPPYGSPAADGISLACKDSEVSNNIVYDTTDGAIVLFGSSGSTVRGNTISSRTRVVLGGVNMVDYDPWDGDYTDVKVHSNSFHADGRYIKVGIVIGPSSWSDDTDSIVRGGAVYDNTFYGAFFGYGIVVSSAQDVKVTGNRVDASAEFSGTPGPRCPTAPPNGPPVPFLINRGSTKGTFQPEFTNGEVQHAICIQPSDFLGKPYKPWRFRDDDKALEKRAAESAKDSAAASGKLTDAVVKYQMTLMARLADLEDHIQALQVTGDQNGGAASMNGPTAAELQQLTQRIQALETGESRVRSEVESIRDDWSGITHKMRTASNKQKPLLDYLILSMASLADGGRRAHASWLSRIAAIIEGIYFGSFGSFMLLTLSGIGIHSLLSKAFRSVRKPRHDKVF